MRPTQPGALASSSVRLTKTEVGEEKAAHEEAIWIKSEYNTVKRLLRQQLSIIWHDRAWDLWQF